MKKKFLLWVVALCNVTFALAQLSITSLNSNGELTWTNSIYRGFYTVESAANPAGPWTTIATAADVDWAKTNQLAVQLESTNTSAFYRVQWVSPDPVGEWAYKGYDMKGNLVITGQLNIVVGSLVSTNSPSVEGTWDLQYAGPPTTNILWWLGPQMGTGYLGGTLTVSSASLDLVWPTNVWDANLALFGILMQNTYTGTWLYSTWAGPYGGPFCAERHALPETFPKNSKLILHRSTTKTQRQSPSP